MSIAQAEEIREVLLGGFESHASTLWAGNLFASRSGPPLASAGGNMGTVAVCRAVQVTGKSVHCIDLNHNGQLLSEWAPSDAAEITLAGMRCCILCTHIIAFIIKHAHTRSHSCLQAHERTLFLFMFISLFLAHLNILRRRKSNVHVRDYQLQATGASSPRRANTAAQASSRTHIRERRRVCGDTSKRAAAGCFSMEIKYRHVADAAGADLRVRTFVASFADDVTIGAHRTCDDAIRSCVRSALCWVTVAIAACADPFATPSAPTAPTAALHSDVQLVTIGRCARRRGCVSLCCISTIHRRPGVSVCGSWRRQAAVFAAAHAIGFCRVTCRVAFSFAHHHAGVIFIIHC